MKEIYQVLRELVRLLFRLRRHLRLGRWLILGVVLCNILSAPFELAGVGLLYPMLMFSPVRMSLRRVPRCGNVLMPSQYVTMAFV